MRRAFCDAIIRAFGSLPYRLPLVHAKAIHPDLGQCEPPPAHLLLPARLPNPPSSRRPDRDLRHLPHPAAISAAPRRSRQQGLPLTRLPRAPASRLDFRHQRPMPASSRPAALLGCHAHSLRRRYVSKSDRSRRAEKQFLTIPPRAANWLPSPASPSRTPLPMSNSPGAGFL